MEYTEYTEFVREGLSDFKHKNDHMSLLYLSMGLIEEVKELYDKIHEGCELQSVVSEAGDVMWYVEALKIKLSYTESLVHVKGNLHDVSTELLVLIKKSVFFNKFNEKRILDILSSLSGRLTLLLDYKGYNTDVATIMATNCLKLRNRYDRNRSTLYINKDVNKEDMLILNYINSVKQNSYEENQVD